MIATPSRSGFSFGGRRTTDALSDPSMSLAAGVSYYAPFLLSDDANKIRAPVCGKSYSFLANYLSS